MEEQIKSLISESSLLGEMLLDPFPAANNLQFMLRSLISTPDEAIAVGGEILSCQNRDQLVAKLELLQENKIRQRLNQNKTTVAILFPSTAYREHAGNLAIRLRAIGYNAIIVISEVASDGYEEGPYVFYGGHGFVERMAFIDIFVVPTLMLGLPLKSKKLLLVHDIYDSPLGDETEFRKLLSEFDYCFLPSLPAIELFKRVASTPDPSVIRNRNLTLIPGGYIKLDRLQAYFHTHQSEEKTIIYAPTVTGLDFDDVISVPEFGEAIIETLLSDLPDYTLIFRPHPHSLRTAVVQRIFKRFRSHPRFVIDENASFYMDNYSRSGLMISDISGTAFTYAFATSRPVVFFSHDEATVQRKYGTLNYVRDREKLGRIVESVSELSSAILDLLRNKQEMEKAIHQFRDQVMFNVGSAEDYLVHTIEKIAHGEAKPEWIEFRVD